VSLLKRIPVYAVVATGTSWRSPSDGYPKGIIYDILKSGEKLDLELPDRSMERK